MNVDCTSFTAVVLILTAVNVDFMLNKAQILQLFAATTTIAFLMYWTDKIPIESFLLRLFLNWADVAAVVFCAAFVFRWITWNAAEILLLLGVLTAVFAVTCAITVLRDQEFAKRINEKIEGRKKGDHNS